MAYSTSVTAGVFQQIGCIGGGFNVGSSDAMLNQWAYRSSDPLATVITTGYFSDGKIKGMRAGDTVVFARLTTGGVPAALHHLLISSVSTNGASATIIASSST
jgi:hypothetical protein